MFWCFLWTNKANDYRYHHHHNHRKIVQYWYFAFRYIEAKVYTDIGTIKVCKGFHNVQINRKLNLITYDYVEVSSRVIVCRYPIKHLLCVIVLCHFAVFGQWVCSQIWGFYKNISSLGFQIFFLCNRCINKVPVVVFLDKQTETIAYMTLTLSLCTSTYVYSIYLRFYTVVKPWNRQGLITSVNLLVCLTKLTSVFLLFRCLYN